MNGAMSTAPVTVSQAFAAAVQRHGARIALIGEDGQTLSFDELDRLRIDAARALLALGVQPGERVGIWGQNCVEWVIAALGVLSVGAAVVPVNTRMRGSEAAYVLERSGARVLFCAGRFLDQHYPTLLAPHRPKALHSIVVLRDAATGDLDWHSFLARAAESDDAAVAQRERAITADSLMDVIFTSGTTGLPKGVMTSHRQNLRTVAEWSRHMSLVPEDRYLVVNPFFHTFGYKFGWLAGLLAGATVLPHAVFDAAALLTRVAQQRVSVLPGPPTLFISILNDPRRAGADLSSLRATITGAATVAPSLIERIRAELGFKVVLTGYGLTESCGVVSLCGPGDDAETVALTCGKPLPDTEVRCVDEAGQAVPAGSPGEIVVRGYNVMQGYLDDAKATAETIDAEGWMHTGDVGILDARGYLRITDRLKDMYIAGGFNCYPAEIERIIAGHPAVAQVAVIGVPDERLGEVGKAFVVPRPQAQIEGPALIAWCREQMANYKVPRFVELVGSLPTNASGKVLKFELRNRT
jgi:acyl-CoA synthetase (AMP-forming)/AMP-acid ligase II